jgi:hypothetical protein
MNLRGLPYTSTFRNLLQVLGEIAVPHILTNLKTPRAHRAPYRQ